jgi:hypothetical protein
LNDPRAVTVLVPSIAFVPVKVNVPRTADGEELVMTSSPDVEVNVSMVPALV